ncbi:MAG: methyltransferase domain-containing protein [Saprospiraceae bacterium]|nr:methyltransferase domain-containing protein [Saprospiraceae bacterium]
MKEWFEDWFDTKYYQALYRDRNEEEADLFIELLIEQLNLPKESKILDIGCGKGRHAVALNQLGFDVTGIDLSFSKIAGNQLTENDLLHFYRHDMRHLFRINYYDFVFNFFTSFGYFESHNDEKNVASAMAANLKWDGTLVLDYLNAEYVRNNLVETEEIMVDDYNFRIHKRIVDDRISKKITIIEEDQCLIFYEKVRLYSLKQMVELFTIYNLYLESVYGSYHLDAYDPLRSERMILVFKKKRVWHA